MNDDLTTGQPMGDDVADTSTQPVADNDDVKVDETPVTPEMPEVPAEETPAAEMPAGEETPETPETPSDDQAAL